MLTNKHQFGAVLVLTFAYSATAAGPTSQDASRRKDRYGDPLPANALARLGTIRLRHGNSTSDLVFTADSKTAIVSDLSGAIVFWDVATGREIRRLQDGRNAGDSLPLAISADGKTLASVGGAGLSSLWEVATGKLLTQSSLPTATVWLLLITPDGKTLAFHDENTIFLWDVVGKKVRHELKGHKGALTRLALSPDGKTLASASLKDRHIRLWDIATGKEKLCFEADKSDVFCVAFSPDGKTLASVGNSGFRLWDAATGKKVREMGRQPLLFAFFPDGKTIAGLEGAGLHIYDLFRGKHLREYDAPSGTLGFSSGEGQILARVVVSPNGKTIASFGNGAHSIDLRDATHGKLLHPDSAHRHGIAGLAFAADEKTIFSATDFAESVLIWDRRLLESLAKGTPRAWLTKEARKSRQRLDGQP